MNSKITKKSIIAGLLAIIIVLSLVGCGNRGEDLSILPSVGAGRLNKSTSDTTAEPEPEPLPTNGITICVDPGHGFEDPGTFSDIMEGLCEKDISLAVAKLLKGHLELLGFTVIMTHDGESFPKTSIDDGNNKFRPEERVAYANSLGDGITYYISLHCNAYPDSSDISGVRLYYADNADPSVKPDYQIAQAIADKLAADFPDNKTPVVQTEKFYVIKYTKVPACLVEMGFVTNQEDVDKMSDPEWQDKFAKSVADALYSYYVPSSN